jgi:penicillin-binding protein 2
MLGREEKVSQIRLTAVQYVLLGIFLMLAFGLWRLQVARSDYYNTLAEQNRCCCAIKSATLTPMLT